MLPLATALAQSPSPPPSDQYLSFRVTEWTLDDGFPQPALAVAQTPDGYLWITTFDGLVRFDGVRFVSFTTANTPAFRSHDLVGLYVSHEGALWTGGRDGWVYRLREGTWTAFDVTDIFQRHWVQGFAEDRDGTLWLVSTGDFVARFDGSNWTAVPQRIRDIWPPFVADAGGTIWTILPSDGANDAATGSDLPGGGIVARWDGERFVPASESHQFGFVPSQYGPLFHRPVGTAADLARDGRVRMDVSDAGGTLLGWFWSDGSPATARLVDRSGRVWVQEWLEGEGRALAIVRDGEVLHRIEPDDGSFIEQVFEDAQGSVWVHSRSTGLFQVVDESFRRFGAGEGVPRFSLRAEPVADGSVFVSSEWGVSTPTLAVVRDGIVTSETFSLEAAPPHLRNRNDSGGVQVGHVVVDGRGQSWGIVGRSLLRLGEGRAEIAWSASDPELWTLDTDPADPGSLWVGSRTGRMYRFDISAGAVTDSFDVAGEPSVVHRGPDGRLWIGSTQGLSYINDVSSPVPIEDPALASQSVRALQNGPNGALWAATEGGGLVRLRDGEVGVIGTDEGLPSLFLSMVLLDDLGHLWLSDRQSLHRLRLAAADSVLDGHAARLDVVTLLPSDGHLGTSNKLSRAALASDGSLWIPSFKGVTRLDPAHFEQQYARPPPVHVEALRTGDGQRYVLTESLELPAGARTITVEYTAIDLRAPGLVQFRTRLAGRDADWVEQGAARSVTYGGLDPGRYTFHVQAMNAGGVWSEPVVAHAFVVPPRFAETPWFLLLVSVGLLGLGAVANRLRVRTLTARQRELNVLVDERTQQLRAEKETVAAQAEALRSLDEAKSRLFANVSHEFRTPLTLIIGPLEDVQSGMHGSISKAVARGIETAVLNARRLLHLVNQLLDVARLEEGRLDVELQLVDMGAFVERVSRAFVPLAERQAIAFHVETPASAPRALIDPEQFEKILANLLGNAFKFTPRGGRISVVLRIGDASDSPLTLTVQDNGPGIAPEHLPYIFERFYQADSSATRRGSGTGIGLALVENLVALHEGTIEVESEVGVGTTFTVRLPIGGDTPDDAAVPDYEIGIGATHMLPFVGDTQGRAVARDGEADPVGESVIDADVPVLLIVDDNAEIRTFVRSHLGARYRVIEAGDGAEALALARKLVPDLIVSDVMMPNLDGFGLVRELRADPDLDFVPVILLTARASAESKLEGLGIGADAYLTKPFDVRELRVRVDSLIARQQRLKVRIVASAETSAIPLPERGEDAFIPKVRAIVEARLPEDDFDVDALAEALGLGRTTLYRRFGEAFEGTPMDLVWSMRLERAAVLLRERAGTVGEVAYAVGFKTVAHFCNRFREEYGCTPATYAEENVPD
jgi:signal transduction histidine kinase/CheY-like chemotaxis protein/AraC-like DNA-binding protein